MPHLEITEIALIHCNIVNNGYQHDSVVLWTFFPKKLFDQLLEVSLKNVMFLKTFSSVLSYIKIWFTKHISKLVKIEDKKKTLL